MAGINFTTHSVPANHGTLNGGLNSTSGPLGLQDNEASDLQNIDFNKFGSILKRNGYSTLNTTALTGATAFDGLHWFEFTSSGATVRKSITVNNGTLYKMDDLDGTWDDITGTLTITSTNDRDWETQTNVIHQKL